MGFGVVFGVDFQEVVFGEEEVELFSEGPDLE